MSLRKGLVAAGLAAALLSSGAASALTLTESLRLAYQNNPGIQANRAAMRGQDETYTQAIAATRPSIGLTGSAASTAPLSDLSDPFNELQVALGATLTVFDGGKSRDAVASAEQLVLATRESLGAAEQQLLLSVAVTYLDVLRAISVVESSRNSVRVLEQQLRAAQDRFDVGATTRTDVSLTKARLEAAKSTHAANQGSLVAAQEFFRALVGVPAANLAAAPALPRLPSSEGEAESIALREHPSLKYARHVEMAADIDLKRARKVRTPEVTLTGSVGYTDDSSSDGLAGVRVELAATMPLYQGGALPSIVRQAASVMERRRAETQNVMADVRRQVAQAWSNLQVANISITAYRAQLAAAQAAYDGIAEETRLGSRTTLDLLDAEQDLLTAKTSLAGGQRDVQAAGYALLASMGLLTVDTLKLGIPAYDPSINFAKVKSAPVSFSGAEVMDNIAGRWGE